MTSSKSSTQNNCHFSVVEFNRESKLDDLKYNDDTAGYLQKTYVIVIVKDIRERNSEMGKP